MVNILDNLESWFGQRPLWFQDAARRIIQTGVIGNKDLDEIIQLCKQEVGIIDPNQAEIPVQGVQKKTLKSQEGPVKLNLEEISNIKGINALSPRNPLKLYKGLNIIYGPNGTGKSGYVRILKNACGSLRTGELFGNIFDDTHNSEKSCTIRIDDGTSRDINWQYQNGVVDDVRCVEIYDTDCAHVHLTEENEVAYEPPILSLFTKLTEVCSHVGNQINDEIKKSITEIPKIDAQYKNTKTNLWYTALSHNTQQSEINNRCSWDQNAKDRLTELNERLAEQDPAQQAKKLRTTKTNTSNLRDELKKIRTNLENSKCSEYLTAQDDAIKKRSAADVDAKKVFENAPLGGVGSESWILLWEQARAYSEAEAYKDVKFPNVTEGSRCVLCHQVLSKNGLQRLPSFENFVKGELQKEARKAELLAKSLTDGINEMLTAKSLDLKMDAANITDESRRKEISDHYEILLTRKKDLLKAKSIKDIKTAMPPESLLTKLKTEAESLEKQAKKYDKDAGGRNLSELQKEAKELKARKWLSQQKIEIETEVSRLKQIDLLKKAQRSANTGPITSKKSKLADILISPAFIKRFKDEMKDLGASKIKVELIKTRGDVGRVYHKIRLKNCSTDICPTAILSEGEFRIVSLAAFIANVTGPDYNTPFVFDDPISSLDQYYEEKTATRLVELSKSRQVIVFTHRLSLFTLIQTEAKKKNVTVEVRCLRNEGPRIGEPGGTLINEKKPQKALQFILDHRIKHAKKILTNEGWASYEPLGGSICRDIRILIERLIENDLLSDIVVRYRRDITTKNKIQNLAKINSKDCIFLDDFMSKYSVYEHSQPLEAPIPTPDPEELRSDVKAILEWLKEFKYR